MINSFFDRIFYKTRQDTSQKEFTLQNLAILLIILRYLIYSFALIYEYIFSIHHSNEISENLKKLGISSEKYLKCIESYPYGVLISAFCFIVELTSFNFINLILKTITADNEFPSFIIIMLLETIAPVIYTMIDYTFISNLSNTLSTENFFMLDYTSYKPLILIFSFIIGSYSYINELLILMFFELTFRSLIITNQFSNIVEDISDDNPFMYWSGFSKDFITKAVKLLEINKINPNKCNILYLTSKNIIYDQFKITIPTEAKHYYDESALLGYLAFVIGEIKNSIIDKLCYANTSVKILCFVLLYFLISKTKKSKNLIIELSSSIKIVRIASYFLGLIVNFYSKSLELECDRFVVSQNLKSNLLEYIKKNDQDPEKMFSPYFTVFMSIFTPLNSVESRINEILKEN